MHFLSWGAQTVAQMPRYPSIHKVFRTNWEMFCCPEGTRQEINMGQYATFCNSRIARSLCI
jgi:hypothetical protein